MTSSATGLVPDLAAHVAAFRRGAVDVVESRELEARLAKALAANKPLRIKFGMDPSSPDLHLGHAIPLLKLRDLQRLGHTIVLIVGDSTAMVGDPSGRNKLRPVLTREEVERNLVTYTDQAAKLLDMSRTEVRRNSEWFDRMRFEEVLRLCARMTVARMLERDMFQKRIADNEPIGVHEFLYPLMQGWDSVMIRCDVEFGGTDQLFNLHAGRLLQEQESQVPQILVTTPLINGLDGRKMSKSYGNAVALTDPAREMYGKVMSLTDDAMPTWFELLTRLDSAEIAALLAGHPRAAKARLAREITTTFHGDAEAAAAADAFDRQFAKGELPADIPELRYGKDWPADGVPLASLLRDLGLEKSSSDARRSIEQGGVKLDGTVVKDTNHRVLAPSQPLLVQIGKRRFARVVR
ncbi:MAG: tyrosine--tRNA ligase [Planctomycetota bacterium]|nr:MAG: tyrosine--tRNA ligase [Planctomycetota bacterium]